MKKMILCIYLMLAVTTCFAQDEKVIKKKKVCFSIEQLEEDEYWNTYVYPRPALSNEDLRVYLQKKVSYPTLAKQYQRTSSFSIPLTIDVKGRARLADMISYGNPEFEDVAIEILTDSNLLWTPARKNKKAFDMLIHVPVFFYMRYTNDIFYYEVRFFFDFDSFVVDSTNTYPAMVLVDGEHWYTSNQRYFATFSAWDNSKPYGAVSIAFEVDTMGVLSDQKITTSVSKELDEEAMKFVNRTNGKWIPARKDGQKVPSYKYFYCLFNDVYVYEKQNVFTDYISRRKAFESNLNKMNKRNDFTLSQFDKMTAMRLLAEKKYAESLERFNRAAKYYYHDATLFFNRSIANHYLGNKEKSCDDLQHVLDIAESEGFPHGVTKEQVENLISTFCQ